MIRKKSHMAAVVVCIAGLLGMAGCDRIIAAPIVPDTVSIVFVTGIHQGSAYPGFSSDRDKLIDWLTRAEAQSISVFNATGEASTYDFGIGIDWGAPRTTVEHKMETYFSDTLRPQIERSVVPKNDGANYVEAILLAAQSIKEDPSKEKIIYVSGNGLSDTGVLKFAEGGYLSGAPSIDGIIGELMTQITFNGDELKGFKIVWHDMGVTSPPQDALMPPALDTLKKLYTSVFELYGADRGMIDITAPGKHIPDAIATDKTVMLVSAIHDDFKFSKSYDESSELGFKPDRPKTPDDPEDFIDAAMADAELRSIAEQAMQHPERVITITGYMAWLQSEAMVEHSELARRRAERVRDRLVALGVPEDRFVIDDKGNSESTRSGDESVLKKDRRVHIEF